MVKATKLSSPPEWAEPRVAVVAFVSSDFCDACSALVTRLNVSTNITELQNREILKPTKAHSVIHICQLQVLARCKVSEGNRYKITAPSGRSAATLHPPKPFTPLYSSSTGRRPFVPAHLFGRRRRRSIYVFPLHRRNVSWQRCLGRV